MRLINTQTLGFEEFYRDVPPYAILSHRWESEEVTFQDYAAQVDLGNTKPMKGFKKIRHCIDQAKKDELSYCWVDTCCIDKSSSAELTEAINSMYAWYRDSAACYIYMSDVQLVPAYELLSTIVDAGQVQQFKFSKWFERGWTLQELLAPRRRVFYNCSWQEILDLDEFRFWHPTREPYRDLIITVIEEATGISRTALMNFSPISREYPVALKMSWASNRVTTRIEDTSYCLMGIFDINMPLLYGEGDKAFLRLQEEIINKTRDQTIFCWTDSSASDSTYRGLLARSPQEFQQASNIVPLQPGLDTGLTFLPWKWEDSTKVNKVYGMTNNGLQITLPLSPAHALSSEDIEWLEDGEFYAELECRTTGETQLHCFLRLVHLGGGVFARVSPYYLPKFYQSDLASSFMLQEIFVHDNPHIHRSYNSSRISGAQFNWSGPVWVHQQVTSMGNCVDSDLNSGAIWFSFNPHDSQPQPVHVELQARSTNRDHYLVIFLSLEWTENNSSFTSKKHLALNARFMPGSWPSHIGYKIRSEGQIACLDPVQSQYTELAQGQEIFLRKRPVKVGERMLLRIDFCETSANDDVSMDG